jgi:hypothetical protein
MDIKPNLQFSVLCDDVRREDNGKLMLLGLFEVIGARKFPATHSKLFVVNRWCKGEGEFSQKVKIINSKDNKVVIETDEQDFTLQGIDSNHTVISAFNSVVFPSAGKYWVEVYLGDDLILNYPVMLTAKEAR